MAEKGGFDLQSLLQDEDTVRQLRQMAGSMGLSDKLEEALRGQGAGKAPPPPAPPDAPSISPQMVAAVAKVAKAMQAEGPETRFLQSLGPLLRPERRPKVQEAAQMLRMVQALEALGENGLQNLLSGLSGQGKG